MIGAIAGDIIGSRFEWNRIKTTEFDLFSGGSKFTDDTVLTVAVADAIMSGEKFEDKIRQYYHLYPKAGFGGSFKKWANNVNGKPYNSYGNGSAMRVSPVAWAYDSLEGVLTKAKESAECTHNHEEGIKGAQAVAGAIFLARKGQHKDDIKQFVESKFGYDLDRKLDDIRLFYGFEVSCQKSVPEAIICFLESSDYESAIRNAVSLGGDSDTQACIAGSIAEAYYKGVPQDISRKALMIVGKTGMNEVVKRFIERFVSYVE